MGSRLLPLALVAGALLADGVGLHRIASYLVLLAVPAAAASAFVGVADVMEGKNAWARAIGASLALALLLLGAAVRGNAPGGGAVPALAVSALVAALVMYALLPLVGWLVEPLRPRRREPRRVREARRPAETRTAKAA
jgi:peptidoglycan/LPS O-acetylase OafA/YrhL